jgi:DNA repair protein RadC
MAGQDTPKTLTIRELPRSERPRERLIDLGAQALSSAELLAIVLGSGGLGRTALQLGQAVLSVSGGSLRRIAMQPVAALTSQSGIGIARGWGAGSIAT